MLVAHRKPKALPDFQPLGAAFFLEAQALRSPFGEFVAHFGPFRPIHAAENLETLWRRGFEVVQVGVEQVFAPAAVQVDVQADVHLVEPVEQLG